MHVIIAGGGIGGLTTALCLAKAGIRSTVLERNEAFMEVGAGIQLSPNCSRILHDLHLETALAQVGFLPEATQFRHWRKGHTIVEAPLGEVVQARYGVPYYHVHRGDLLQILLDAAKRVPQINLHTSKLVVGFKDDGVNVTVRCQDETFVGDILVGADGIHSTVHTQLWGESNPRFTGNVAWRATVPAADLPAGRIRPTGTVWWGPHKHFVHYFVKGGQFVNCVCVVEKTGWTVESWTERGDIAELKDDFYGWHADVQLLLDHVDTNELYKWALFDRDPMAQWGRGLVTLLGDACHPTLPFMAQGAAMAIEDAAVLTKCLAYFEAPSRALERYEQLRHKRTANIQLGSRRNAKVFHLSGWRAWARNRAAGAAQSRAFDALYRYNALNVDVGEGVDEGARTRVSGGST